LAPPQIGRAGIRRAGGQSKIHPAPTRDTTMKNLKIVLALPVFALLAACSSGPSEGDIEKAIKKNVEMANEQVKKMTGQEIPANMRTEVLSTKKLGCADGGGNAYNCDVEVEIKSIAGVIKQPTKLRMVKGSDGWAVSQ
jgi:hypothetical protein